MRQQQGDDQRGDRAADQGNDGHLQDPDFGRGGLLEQFARLAAQNIDQPVDLTGDVVARRVKPNVEKRARLRPVIGQDHPVDVLGDAMRDLELGADALDVLRPLWKIAEHIVQGCLCRVEFILHARGDAHGLIGVGRRVQLVGRQPERLDPGLGFGQSQPRRAHLLRKNAAELVKHVDAQQAEPVRQCRHHAEAGNQQHGFCRDRQPKSWNRQGHGGMMVPEWNSIVL